MVLTELEMTCVQVVFVKIMTVAYPTVTSEVTQILLFILCLRNIVLFKVFHIFSWFRVSGIRGQMSENSGQMTENSLPLVLCHLFSVLCPLS